MRPAINDNSKDLDFRVESDNNANALFVDGSTGTTGFGAQNPQTAYNFIGVGGIYIGNGNQPSGDFMSIDAEGSAGGTSMTFYRYDSSATQYQNRLSIAGETAETVFNNSGLDVDFRVESDADTHMLFVDAGADHVNIGTSSDFGQRLNVNGGIGLATDPTVTWTSNYLKFQTRSASVPVIEFLASASGNYAPRIDVMNGTGTVQHRIDAGGATTFNETGADKDFRVESDSNTHMMFR